MYFFYTFPISKDNEAARRRHRRRICKYVEDANDEANKVSQRKRDGMIGRVKMKILGIMGSPRVGGNSDILLDEALAGAKAAGAAVEKIILDRKKIAGCKDCTKCNETGICVIKDDMLEIHQKILDADAIIHSVPVYFWSMTGQMKTYLDRWCAFFDAEWRWQKAYYQKMKGKRVGLITVCGDPNVHTADPIVHSFKSTAEMTKMNWLGVVMAAAADKGDIAQNKAALQQARELGEKAAK
jgi:multimeric flavodoxin WrbA